MKKSIIVLIAIPCIALGIGKSYQLANNELVSADARPVISDISQDNYSSDVKKYKEETAAKIAANNKSLADFKKKRINEKKKAARKDYEAKISKLETKNADLKLKMENYKEDGKEGWEKFKIEFSRDMEELGKAFSDLTKKNVK